MTLLVLLFATAAHAQSLTVSGTVKDTTGEPVIGATVVVLGEANKGATTDLDGNFTIQAVPSSATLRITFVGMKPQEVAVNGRSHIDIVLREDSELLDEVVVVGYGTQKKANLTGSVSSVDTKALEARPVQNVGQALQGVVPGLNLGVTNGGGALDKRMSLNIRGTGTIGEGSNSSPLVLIDGTEGDLFSIAPNDIESISVLKDASSSAIYGSRAAFGVILVTTKSGKKGRTTVSYNGNVRFSTATQVPHMLDALEFVNYFNAGAANIGEAPTFKPELIQKIKDHMSGKTAGQPTTTWNSPTANEPWAMYGGSWDNTDWFAEMYKKNVPSQEHNISLSGGSERINYYVSGAILDQNGLIRHGKDTFRRYNFSGKFTADVTDWFTITYNTKWVREDYSRPSYMTGLFFHNIARRWPTNPVKDPNGFYMHGNEILQMRDGGKDINQTDRLYQQAVFEFRPLDGWMIRLEGNYNTTHGHNHWDVLPIYAHDPKGNPFPVAWSGDYAAGKSKVGETMWKSNYFNTRLYSEYARVFAEKHDFKAVAGMDMEASRYTRLNADRADLITPDVPTLNKATHKDVGAGFADNHWATMGFFGRVNYAYDNRYLAEISVRRDGSSRFIGDKTWATFPSISIGWNIANEGFFEPLHQTVNQLKLRGSWGTLGNTNVSALYPWFLSQPVWPKGGWLINGEKQNISGVPGLVSPNLTWETIESWTVGLDFGLFNNRLQGSFDYFVRNTLNMVGAAPEQPSILGVAQPAQNNSDMRSMGWELELKWRDNIGDFSYGARVVLSDDKQVITRYYNPTKRLNQWYEGEVLGTIWGYQTAGIAQSNEEMKEHLKNNTPSWGSDWAAGDVMYVNQNDPVDKDGNVIADLKGKVDSGKNTFDDHGDLVVIGNRLPHYRFGINLDMAWKGIDFSIFMQGVGKRDVWIDSPYLRGANDGVWQSAGFKEHLDFWRPADDKVFGPNPNAYFPRPLLQKGWKNFQPSDRYLQDASYMRIKNVQLGYTLPVEWSKKVSINRLRVYVSADNLYTFTKMSTIFDPEATGGDWGPGKLYPLQRTLSLGCNLTF